MLQKIRHLTLLFAIVVFSAAGHPPATAQPDLPYRSLSRPDRGKPLAMAWSPDGRYIAIGTDQGLWVYTDTFVDVAHLPNPPIHALAWNPDGTTLAAGYFGEPAAQGLEASPSGTILGGGIRLWQVQASGRGVRVTAAAGPRLLENGAVYALEFSPDGRRLASLSQGAVQSTSDGPSGQDDLRIFDQAAKYPDQWTESHHFQKDSVSFIQQPDLIQGANGLVWGNRGRYLASIHFPIWDSLTGQWVPYDVFPPEPFPYSTIAWAQPGYLVIGSAYDGRPSSFPGIGISRVRDSVLARLPDLADEFWGRIGDVYAVAARPKSGWLAYTFETTIRLWDTTTQRKIAVLDAAFDNVRTLRWSPDGRKLLATGSDYVVRLWIRFEDYQTPTPKPIRAESYPPFEGQLSPDGQWLASPGKNRKEIHLTHFKTGTVHQTLIPALGENDQIWSLYWSPDGQYLAALANIFEVGCVGLQKYTLYVWSVGTGDLVFRRSDVTRIAWRPDSAALALGLDTVPEENEVHTTFEIRTVDAWQVLQPPPPDEVWGTALTKRYGFDRHYQFWPGQWSPDGRLLAFSSALDCGSYGATSVVLWDTKTRRIVAEIPDRYNMFTGSGGRSDVQGWSPGGAIIAVEGSDRSGLYRLRWEGDHLTVSRISVTCSLWRTAAFSPDGRYALCQQTVIDTHTGWPIFRFRRPMDFAAYRWESETLTGYDFSGGTEYASVVTFRTGDFLPPSGR